MINFKSEVEAVDTLSSKMLSLQDEIKKRIYGQDEIVKQVLVSMFSRGHCLLIGVPGLAKTLLVNTIAEVFNLKYSRIQFTPDLMPSVITSYSIHYTKLYEKKVGDALELMRIYRIGGIPVVDAEKHLVGIVTNRDLRFENDSYNFV